MSLARAPLNDLCFYLDPAYLVGWVRNSQQGNIASFAGCLAMFNEFNKALSSNFTICGGRNSFSTSSGFHLNCVLSAEFTDWNFMPFRVRSLSLDHRAVVELFREPHMDGTIAPGSTSHPITESGSCLTAKRVLNSHHFEVFMSPCVKYERYRLVNASYSYIQLFHFYPLLKTPQTIRYLDLSNGGVHCLTAVSYKGSHMYYGLELHKCVKNVNSVNFRYQLFTAWGGTKGGRGRARGGRGEGNRAGWGEERELSLHTAASSFSSPVLLRWSFPSLPPSTGSSILSRNLNQFGLPRASQTQDTLFSSTETSTPTSAAQAVPRFFCMHMQERQSVGHNGQSVGQEKGHNENKYSPSSKKFGGRFNDGQMYLRPCSYRGRRNSSRRDNTLPDEVAERNNRNHHFLLDRTYTAYSTNTNM